MIPNKTTEDTQGETPAPAKSATFWQQQIELAEKDHDEFWKYGAKCEKRFKNEKDTIGKAGTKKRLNILYSNTETLKASLYARTAKPDVRQRHTQQADKLGKTVAEMMERLLTAASDCSEHDRAYRKGVQDMALPGRGVVKVCYEPELGVDPETGQEIITDQEVEEEFVYYKDFLHSPSQCWEQVWWVAFRHRMTREDLRDNKFDDAETIPLNWTPDTTKKDREVSDDLKRAEVWEIWHKAKKERVYIVKGHPNVLRTDPDPYGLDDFYPMAEPIQAVTGNDTLVPSAYFQQYEDQADDLDEITARISILTKALRRRGVYNAGIKELKRLAKASDNEFIPAEDWASFAASGGLKGAFDTEDIAPIAQTIVALYEQKGQLMQAIYDTVGISDILRGGSTDPNETATAQALKSQNGSIRMKLAQRDVQRWVRDTLRIKAELVAEHFEPKTLLDMSGMKLPTQAEIQAQLAQAQMEAMQTGQEFQPPEEMPLTIDDVVKVLRDDKLRSYHIDIETDSTVFEDAEAEKAGRTELLTAMSGFLQQWMPVAQMGGAPMVKLGFDMLSFGVRGFKAGRQLEDSLDEARASIEQAAAQPPEPPPPDPKVEGEKIKLQGVQMKAEADMQKTQMDMQKSEAQHAMDMQKMALQRAMPQGGANGFQA